MSNLGQMFKAERDIKHNFNRNEEASKSLVSKTSLLGSDVPSFSSTSCGLCVSFSTVNSPNWRKKVLLDQNKKKKQEKRKKKGRDGVDETKMS